MSVTGILSSNLLNYSTQSVQDRMQQFRKHFQQLGQDLQTGNLSGAKADFAALQNDSPQATVVELDEQLDRADHPAAQRRLAVGQPDRGAAGLHQPAAASPEPGVASAAAASSSPESLRGRAGQRHLADAVATGAGLAVGRRGLGAEGLQHVEAGSAAVRDRKRGARWDGFAGGERERVG